MKGRKAILLLALFPAMGLLSCDDESEEPATTLMADAKLQEEGQTLSPGETVHLLGTGYQENDEVMLDFYWETGEYGFPFANIIAYRAKITSSAANGISIMLPYRKPESDVEIKLRREGEMQTIGKVHLKDGTTPPDIRLYGINNNLHGKENSAGKTAITRCALNDADYGIFEWSAAEHPDFHCAVSGWRRYGVCGLSEKTGSNFLISSIFLLPNGKNWARGTLLPCSALLPPWARCNRWIRFVS